MAFDLDDEELEATRKLHGVSRIDIDTRPQAIDMSLCTQELCGNKCKRWHGNWKPAYWQSYIRPAIEYDAMGNIKECNSRME